MIRPLEEGDKEAVVGLWLEASALAHPFIERAFWEGQVQAMHEVYLPLGDTLVYVDEATERITGFVSMIEEYLAALFVLPEEQKKGIGTRLLRIAKRMHPEIHLSVYAENTVAIRFYAANGFVVAGERTDEVTGHEELLMVRSGSSA